MQTLQRKNPNCAWNLEPSCYRTAVPELLLKQITPQLFFRETKNDFECKGIKANYFYIFNNRLWYFYFVK